MNECKMAMKRALNEYKGKKDYERLLEKYAQLDACCVKAMQDGNRLARRLEASDNLVRMLKVALTAVITIDLILGALLVAWLISKA